MCMAGTCSSILYVQIAMLQFCRPPLPFSHEHFLHALSTGPRPMQLWLLWMSLDSAKSAAKKDVGEGEEGGYAEENAGNGSACA